MEAAYSALLVLGLMSPLHSRPDYALSPVQRASIRTIESCPIRSNYATPSEAAYAASLAYARIPLQHEEIGAKIFADFDGRRLRYAYGPVLSSVTEASSGDEALRYATADSDGHLAVVGLWHEHPQGASWDTLAGHVSEIERTHQSIWTTVGSDFYVQFWDGESVAPAWTQVVPAIDPLCKDCALRR
jgi:hypothetical protein